MGDWDIFCALCGVVCGSVGREYGYDNSIIKNEDDVAWAGQVMLISENPNASTLSKAYVTGVGKTDGYGQFEVTRGHDPNFDTSLWARAQNPEDDTKSCYLVTAHQWNRDQAFAVAMHRFCYEQILCRMVDFYTARGPITRVSMPIGLDEDVLYRSLKGQFSGDDLYPRAPEGLDYEEAGSNHEQYWPSIEGEEWLVMSPDRIDELTKYYLKLPGLQDAHTQQNYQMEDRPFQGITSNVFSMLPESLILQLLSYLQMKDISALRASMPVIARIELSPGFWKSRVLRDMPWLYDLPSGEEGVDWRAVYMHLQDVSHKSSPRKLHGLANRRRIWKICDQVAQLYIQEKPSNNPSVPHSQVKLLSEATSSRTPRLIWPDPADTTADKMLFVNDAFDIGKKKLVISAFIQDGIFHGLSLSADSETTHFRSVGLVDIPATVHTIQIEEDDWIVGFILFSRLHEGDKEVRRGPGRSLQGMRFLTRSGQNVGFGQQDGDQRITHVNRGEVVIGLNSVWSKEHGISRLALLGISANSIAYTNAADLDSFADYAESDVSQYLWKTHLPSPQLVVGETYSGYWSYDLVADVAARESLVLGHSESELSSITAIAVDVNLGSFRVEYCNQPSKQIGPRARAMQVLAIDGRGGERVVVFENLTNHITQGVRFITNRGRQLIVGQMLQGFRKRSATTDTRLFAGLCCYWTDAASPKVRLELLAPLFIPANGELSVPAVSDVAIGEDNPSVRELAPLPESWSPIGPVLGDDGSAERRTFLDFSRSVQRVDICVGHRYESRSMRLLGSNAEPAGKFPLMSIMISYADGTVASIGPTEFHPEIDLHGGNDPPWCWCQMGPSSDSNGKSHYHVESWDVRQQKLKSLQVWRHDSMLLGIQFTAEDDTESPQWGDCVGHPNDEIAFGGDDSIVGLLCFVGSNQRPVTYPDMIIVALQALTSNGAPTDGN